MFKPRLSASVNVFGIERFENGTYKITNEEEFLISTLKEMRKFNFDGIELSTLGPWNIEEEHQSYPFVKRACELIKDYGINLTSVHLPFACLDWNFSSLDEKERKLAVETFKWAVDFYQDNMPDVFVIHPDDKPKTPEERPYKLESLAKSMSEICDFLPYKVCVENMTNDGLLNVSSEAVSLLKAVPKLNMTIDVNHTLYQKPEDYILAVGDRVKNAHISDRDEIKERHYLPGKGILDFNKIISALDSVNYKGTFTYEVNLKRGSDCTIEDVKNNYEKLFNEYNN